MSAVSEKMSRKITINWIRGVITALEKEDLLLDLLMKNVKLMPKHCKVILRIRQNLLELLSLLDDELEL